MRGERSDPPAGTGLNRAEFWHYYRRYPYLLAKLALWTAVFGVVYFFIRHVDAVAFPVLVSLLIAYLLDPAVDWLEAHWNRVPAMQRLGLSRTAAIFVFLLVILMALTGFILILYPALANQVRKLVERLPELLGLIRGTFIPWLETSVGVDVPADVSTAMDQYADSIQEALPEIARRVTQWTGGLITQTGAVVASLLNLVMIPIFSFYFLRDFDLMTAKWAEFVPQARRDWYTNRIALMDEVVGEWFRGQVTVAIILAVLYGAGLGITFGVAGIGSGAGVAIGILSGILNIIPYFGFLIGFVLSVLMVLLDWGGIGPLFAVGAVFLVVQLLEGYVITPKIVGEKVGLSPVTVIIVLLLGGELFGLLGVLLAIPVAGIVRVLLPDIIAYYKQSPFYSGQYDMRPEGVVVGEGSADLAESTDGSVEEAASVDAALPSETAKGGAPRPVTDADARVTDRAGAEAVMDEGTDGDPEDPPPTPTIDEDVGVEEE